MQMDVGYGSHWLYVIVCDLIQSGGMSNFTSAYNQKALYVLCLADYMCGAMCWSCHVALHHVHIVRSVTWSESPVHGYDGCPPSHVPMYPPPTTPSSTYQSQIETAVPHLCRKFFCIGGPLLQ
jgi:hypothetical protein